MLAMYHDYRIFNPSKGFLCLNELDFGVPLRPPMSSVFREKLHPSIYKSMVLEAKRFSGKDALEAGIVDALGGLDEVLVMVKERKLAEKGKSGVYNLMKMEMYRESLGYLESFGESEKQADEQVRSEEKRKAAMKARVAEWKRNASGKAKL